MPIRLLHFRPSEQHESKLQITLLDRSGVYDYLKAVLDIEYSEEEFQEAVANSNSGPEAKNNVIKNWVNLYARYAILSHTWIRDSGAEVTYSIWNSGRFNTNQSGYQKLANFCKTAWIDHGIVFGWMDTICINKESSSELDESIRSMYKWYRNAHVCITYLVHTGFRSDMHNDAWFTRGWTFQELLAPRSMKFYNKDWQRLNDDLRRSDKDDDFIIHEIQQATTLTYAELQCDAKDLPISRKMELAAKRAVQREEDTAYSLMGICNVSISIAYGEGANRAFFRLIMEILNSSDNVLDVFNCSLRSPSSSDTNRQYTSYILPWGPLAYSHRSRELEGLTPQRPLEPLMLTHLGLRISVLLIPGGDEDYTTFIDDPIGDYYAKIQFMKGEGGKKLQKYTYNLLDKGLGIHPQFDGSTWTLDNSDPSPPLPVTSEDRASENLVFSPNSMNNIELPVELSATLKASNTDEEPPTHWADNLSNQGREAELDTPNPWPVDEFGQEYLEPGIGWTVADTTFGILNIGGDKTNIEVPNTCLAIGFQSHWSVEWEATSTYISKHDTDEPIVFKLQKRDTDISLNSAGYSIRRSELAKHGMKLVTMLASYWIVGLIDGVAFNDNLALNIIDILYGGHQVVKLSDSFMHINAQMGSSHLEHSFYTSHSVHTQGINKRLSEIDDMASLDL
ncbi:hypothetical protein BDN70DRAFT_933787 [Pholiota conissans]|uniref:Heterokaryon incompatibility domain-containing protein n=1 Tax=Pholiota conissans TaxID=109636 RepID=A0A9P5Z0K7_9AGAR|nr:hypothetical protein BDN70DRAFT_933787 [Pholiota conissans]